MRIISWKQIVITAVITGIVTILASIAINWLLTDKLHLSYIVTESIPFPGQDLETGIYQVQLVNDGNQVIDDIYGCMRIPKATIEKPAIDVDPTIIHDIAIKEDKVILKIVSLNPNDIVRLSVLAQSSDPLPKKPEFSIRGRGIIGVEKSLKQEPIEYTSQLLVLLTGIIASLALLGIVYSNFKKSLIYKKSEDIDDIGLHSDDQKDILAYIFDLHDLEEEAQYYYSKREDVRYWLEADRLTKKAIKSKDNKRIEMAISVLKDLLKYASIADNSQAIIYYNIAYLYGTLNNNDEMKKNFELAKSMSSELIVKRLSIDEKANELMTG